MPELAISLRIRPAVGMVMGAGHLLGLIAAQERLAPRAVAILAIAGPAAGLGLIIRLPRGIAKEEPLSAIFALAVSVSPTVITDWASV